MENLEAPFYRSPKEEIPRLPVAPDVHQRLDDWPAGRWLHALSLNGETDIGRVAWSPLGLHVGIRLPDRVTLESYRKTLQRVFSTGSSRDVFT